MTVKRFPRFAPAQYHCKKCGRSPMEIWAFVHDEIFVNTGGVVQRAELVLVCDAMSSGCGCFFDLAEYDLTERRT
jgi:hypothetical protein